MTDTCVVGAVDYNICSLKRRYSFRSFKVACRDSFQRMYTLCRGFNAFVNYQACCSLLLLLL